MTALSSEDAPVVVEDARRRAVLESAARLLAEEGPQGLSLRRVAAEAGGSTQLIYTLFGGKPGLADALYAEGFTRLADRMRHAADAAPGGPGRLVALGTGYRAFARAEPDFFAVMFGRAIPGFSPRRETRAGGRLCTLGQVVAEVQACYDAGTLVAHGVSADDLARQCWLTAHGLASLEVAGLLAADDPEAFATRVLQAPLEAHLPR
jgi:AcrR family transcriptional regulator